MSRSRRVVITGVGLVSPLGNTKQSLWEHLQSGKSGVVAMESVPPEVPAFGGVARDFSGHIDDFGELGPAQKKAIRKGLKLMCRESLMGVAAAQKALADSRAENGSLDPDRAGVIFGTDYMMTLPEDFLAGVKQCSRGDGRIEFTRWATDGMSQVTPLWLLLYLPNMPASHVAIYNDFRGPNNSITHREAAANLAVGEAFAVIARGDADLIIAGATGTRIHPTKSVHALQQEEIVTNGFAPEEASRPFDRDRRGMVLGEGAAAVVLEELGSAQRRSAEIHGEVIGRGSSAVLEKSLVADRRKALVNVMRAALADGDIEPVDVGHIHAHSASTRSGDSEEAAAITEVFGPADRQPPVVALKSYCGHLGAGSGMVELISSLLALRQASLFPVLNFKTPDENALVAVVRDHAVPAGDNVLNLSVTPQGQASAVLVRR